MKDQDLMERLKNQEVDIPESLTPKAVEELLEKKARVRRTMWKKAAAAAALFFIICGAVFGAIRMDQRERTGTEAKKDQKYDVIYQMLSSFEATGEKDISQVLMDSASSGERVATQKAASPESADQQAEASMFDSAATADHSETNIQTQGVDEGDIVKTDGKYLYVLDTSYNTVSIVQAEREKLEKKSVIEVDEDLLTREFYVSGDKLTVLGEELEKNNFQTKVYTYDIQDRESPGKPKVVTQSGSWKSSRMRNGYLYVFSGYSPRFPVMKTKPEQYVPVVCGQPLEPRSILVPQKAESPEYLVMTAIDLEKPDRTRDRKAMFSSGEIFYVSSGYIYAAAGNYGKNTEIQKFSYQKGKIQHQATGTVKGYLEDSFSMDEHQSSLRLVTTLDTAGGGTYNNVYVLDENMKVTGSILKLAKDERIYSARFMGDIGYFVTFRETDPLFSVDFSDPSNPKIIGQLKIPGFSDYLHFYGKNKLLGIGMNTDKEGNAENVKLSMFDISDPKDVNETDVYVLKGCYTAEALYDHHAVMIDQAKNLIGFAAESEGEAGYYLFQYDKGFKQVAKMSMGQSGYSTRGVYIGEYFYLVEDSRIRTYKMDDFREIGEVKL
ncbi:MAG: hypothetical protein HFE75_01130 [Firmicutes bacterium]|jgi:uncharacterized secreted protein with C-terminal beta-propeller domain|nr:hypothetical protein [Bacillota bacterium]NBI62442.1 hypothetical protein [Clostridiales bacterium]